MLVRMMVLAAALALAACAPVSPAAPAPLAAAPAKAAAPDPKSAEAAVAVAQRYYALIEQGRYAEALQMRRDGGVVDASGVAAYADYHAQLGPPGQMEGAAGSSFVEVPVTVTAQRAGGAPVRITETVTLRRINDVPGSTPEQRLWHIERIDTQPG